MTENGVPTPPSAEVHPIAPRPRKRRWLKRLLIGGAVLVALLVLLVALAPTLVGTAPVRGIIFGQVNGRLNGAVAVDSLSASWTGGIEITGLKVVDAAGRTLASADRFYTPISLWDAARGNYDLGKTVLVNPVVHLTIDQNGKSNFSQLVKSSGSPSPDQSASSGPGGLPNVRGTIEIQNLRGTVAAASLPKTLTIQRGDLTLKVPGLNQPIEEDVKLVASVGDGKPGTISLSGSATLFKEGKFDAAAMTANQILKIESLDAAAIAPFLAMAKIDLAPAGIINADFKADVAGADAMEVNGRLGVDDFALGGAAMGGDTLRSAKLAIPIGLKREMRKGVPWLAGSVGIEADQGNVALIVDGEQAGLPAMGQAVVDAIKGTLAPTPPTASVILTADLDLAGVVNQLPHLLRRADGATLTAGRLTHRTSVSLSGRPGTPGEISSETKLDRVTGTMNGRGVHLTPVELSMSARLGAGDKPGPRGILVSLKSGFAQLYGGGESLDALTVKGGGDLGQMRRELGQFIDIGPILAKAVASIRGTKIGDGDGAATTIAGTWTVALNGSGDPAQIVTQLQARLEARDLAVTGLPGGGDVRLPTVVVAVDGSLDRSAAGAIRGATLMAQLGEDGATLDLSAKAEVSLSPVAAPSFSLDHLRVDLARAQRDLSSLVPALAAGEMSLDGGQLLMSAAGSYADGTLTLTAAMVNPTQVHLSRAIDGRRRVLLNGLTAKLTAAGTVHTAGGTTMDLSKVSFNSDFATMTLTDAKVDLRPGGSVWDKLASATITLRADDLAKVQNLLDAIAPATGEKPLRLTGGSLALDAKVSRDGNVTRIVVPAIKADAVAFSRGEASYRSAPINLALSAKVATEAAGIDAIEVGQLAGSLGVATVEMTEPIKLAGMQGDLVAGGSVKLAGDVAAIMGLVGAIQGNAPDDSPYGGQLSLTQAISTRGDTITAKGTADVANLTVRRDGKVVFDEKSLHVGNDLAVDTAANNLSINTLAVDAKTSRAIVLNVGGKVLDYSGRRRFDGMKVDLAYDLMKLFELARPMMAESTRAKLADAKMWGQYRRVFTVEGSLPANVPFGEAIKQLRAEGGLAVGGFQGMGVELVNLDVPVTLADGKLTIAPAPGQPAPKPAGLNGGTLDLNGAMIDLTGDEPRLTLPDNRKVVSGVSMNKVLASKAMGAFNPLFVNPDKSGGLIEIVALRVRNMPLGTLLTHRGADAGTAELSLSINDLAIENPFTRAAVVFLDRKGGGAMFQGGIKDARLSITNGVLTQQLALDIGGFTLAFSGQVALADGRLMPLNITIPAAQLAGIDKNLVKYLPQGITIPITGTTEHFNIAIDRILPKLIADAATKALIDRGLGGLGGKKKNQGGAAPNNPADPLGDLLRKALEK